MQTVNIYTWVNKKINVERLLILEELKTRHDRVKGMRKFTNTYELCKIIMVYSIY